MRLQDLEPWCLVSAIQDLRFEARCLMFEILGLSTAKRHAEPGGSAALHNARS